MLKNKIANGEDSCIDILGFKIDLFKITRETAKNKIILVTTDKAVLANNSINEVLNSFKDPAVGCITGRPVSLNPKTNVIGYWSHLLFDAGAHRIRKELSFQEKFFECTNYLFAFKNGFGRELADFIALEGKVSIAELRKRAKGVFFPVNWFRLICYLWSVYVVLRFTYNYSIISFY